MGEGILKMKHNIKNKNIYKTNFIGFPFTYIEYLDKNGKKIDRKIKICKIYYMKIKLFEFSDQLKSMLYIKIYKNIISPIKLFFINMFYYMLPTKNLKKKYVLWDIKKNHPVLVYFPTYISKEKRSRRI
jgi:hypothetical protein